MGNRCEQRLTVIGGKHEIRRFQRSHWERALRVRHLDPVLLCPCRFVCQFETDDPGLERLQRLSRRWPGLILLLDYEVPHLKGLVKAKAGQLEHQEIRY